MTYIDYANRYWRVARANFSSNNCAFLYFFLLDYVNGLHWHQPFRCPTALITGTFKVTKQQVINARQELVKLGLIIFKEGTSRQVPPVYYLTTGEEQEYLPDLEKLSVDKSVVKTEDSTVDKTAGETQYQDIDKDNKSHTQEGGRILIDCLEDYLLSNDEWFHNLITQLNLDEKRGKDYVHSFVEYLKLGNVKDKETNDARRHFINWVNKKLEAPKRKTSRQEAPVVQKTSGYDPSFYANMEGW